MTKWSCLSLCCSISSTYREDNSCPWTCWAPSYKYLLTMGRAHPSSTSMRSWWSFSLLCQCWSGAVISPLSVKHR